MGMPAEHERWFYTRGSRAYGMTLRADWYESDRTTTLWANAAAVAASVLGADLAHTAQALMRAAMEDGELLGRREVAIDVAARIAKVDSDALSQTIDSAQVGKHLNDANVLLASWQCAERPSWRIENSNGDRVTLQGVWQREAIRSCIEALRDDERAYAQAGAPPF
jgi:2-hydroxychromene-2-carboxylate isomerase